jgi:hypothetical protein
MISPNHYSKQSNNFRVTDSKSPLRDRYSNNKDINNKSDNSNINESVSYDKSGSNTPT